jgi:hypothetical protein
LEISSEWHDLLAGDEAVCAGGYDAVARRDRTADERVVALRVQHFDHAWLDGVSFWSVAGNDRQG